MKLFKRYYDNKKQYDRIVTRFEDAHSMLIVAPHPDDEIIGCGGILLKYAPKFDVICISSAGVAYGDLEAKPRSDKRIQEFYSVMNYLGVNQYWIFETYGDPPFFSQINQYIDDYCKTIDFLKYDYIFCPYPYDSHPEHAYITQILLRKLLKRNECSKDTQIAFYEVWTPILRPNYYEEIDKVIDEKIKIIRMYSSQLVDGWDYDRWSKGLSSYRSMYSRPYKYSEVFQIVSMKRYLKMKFREVL